MTFLRGKRFGHRVKKFLQSVPARADGSFVSNKHDGITRLHATAPTVTPEETAKLDAKRRRPINFEDLPGA